MLLHGLELEKGIWIQVFGCACREKGAVLDFHGHPSLLMLCELRGEELLVTLSMVTPALVGLGLLCSYAHHLTLLLPGSYDPARKPTSTGSRLFHWSMRAEFSHFGVSQCRMDGDSTALLDGICVCLSGREFSGVGEKK